MNKLIKNQFSIDMGLPFVGYYDPDRKWNGWDCPLFAWEEAVKIVEWINTWTDDIQLKADETRRTIVDVTDPNEPFNIAGENTVTEDGNLILYPVGTGWWIWEAQDN